MTWTEAVTKELMQARRELTAAEEGLKVGTPAAYSRYARALHEAELAEQRAECASRESQRRTWH
jgi:hypothetical protein